MIYVTDVSQYAFCPYSVYLRKIRRVRVVTPQMIFGDVYHRIEERIRERERIVFDYYIKEEMDIEEITDEFYRDAKKVIKNTVLRNKRRIEGDLLDTVKKLNRLFLIKSKEKALLLKKAMETYRKKDVYEIVFPKAVTEFSISSRRLNLCGRIDRLEEIGGRYYPVEIKTGTTERYMEKDILQLSGYAILLEEKFDASVDKGFIDYVLLSKKHEIEIREDLKDNFMEIKHEVEKILEGYVPQKEKKKECESCNLYEVCWGE